MQKPELCATGPCPVKATVDVIGGRWKPSLHERDAALQRTAPPLRTATNASRVWPPIFRSSGSICARSRLLGVPRRDYLEATLAVYELNRVELLREVFAWAYERSCQRYGALRAMLGEPDPFRLRYCANWSARSCAGRGTKRGRRSFCAPKRRICPNPTARVFSKQPRPNCKVCTKEISCVTACAPRSFRRGSMVGAEHKF